MRIFLGYGYNLFTTGLYWELALRRKREVVYVGPDKEKKGPDLTNKGILEFLPKIKENDVFIYIDSGRPYFPKGLERLPCLTACYLIDVHVDLAMRLELAKFFDLIFLAQKDYLGLFGERGFKNIYWIPLACEPAVYHRCEVKTQYDVGFVGHTPADLIRRNRLLKLLSRCYKVNDYKRFYSPEETALVYSASKIVFNCSVRGDLNMRVFEAMACGRLLLTDAIANGLGEIFKNRKHLLIYQNEKELLSLADYYLSHDNERETIAACGSELVRAEHTYDFRMDKVLEILTQAQDQKLAQGAYFRNGKGDDISLSRIKIYMRWNLIQNIAGELRQTSGLFYYAVKLTYLALAVILLLRKKIKEILPARRR